MRERERQRRHRHSQSYRAERQTRRTVNRAGRWIDLDENVLDDYILIDDKNLGPSVPEIDSEEASYPEDDDDDENDNDDDNDDEDNYDNGDGDNDHENGGSHGGRDWSLYKQSIQNAWKRLHSDLDFGTTYPLANSHGNAYQDSSSHSRYTELYSELRAKNDARNNAVRRDLGAMPYSMANSHSEHGYSAIEVADRLREENSEVNNPICNAGSTCASYEMANSHSNYRVFYDSQWQHPGAMEGLLLEQSCGELTPQECHANETGGKIASEQESATSCDIEQCLVQIEESLLNIEQNLLHVQDLDIPELRNLLYKSPNIERSLFEVQDLFGVDGVDPANSKKSTSLDSDEAEENEEEEEEEKEGEEEVWVEQSLTVKDNDGEDDAGAPFLNDFNEYPDMTNIDKRESTKSIDDCYVDWIDGSNVARDSAEESSNTMCPMESAMNFVPNSLGRTPPRRIVLKEVKENIRLCSSEPEEPAIAIDYNLNNACAEKKAFLRDKWHSRANSLDENSIFQNVELSDKREESGESSLRDIFHESAVGGRLAAGAKARSEGALQTDRRELRREGVRSHEELLRAVEATTEDFRKKLESLASRRRSFLDQRDGSTSRYAKEADNETLRTKKKSPARPKRAATVKTHQDNGAGKSAGCDKRKRKRAPSKSATDNTLVPSKLISLSLSLLLAALLQAVRCLTDLVEDAFRSISYDRSGLLQ